MREATLPLVTFYLTERCNSRCVTCDYWRHGRNDATLESVLRVLPDLRMLDTRVALLSGGEPLLNPEWPAIAVALRNAGIKVWLLTSGLSLAKHAAAAAACFDSITVSLDGTNPATYQAIRGLDAFDKVCEGVGAAVARGAAVSLRVTLQRANYRELPAFVALARELGVRQVSFLAVDVGNPHAFARTSVNAGTGAVRLRPAVARRAHRFAGARLHARVPHHVHRRIARQAAAHPAVFRGVERRRRISAGALQCAGVFRGHRCRCERRALLLHTGNGCEDTPWPRGGTRRRLHGASARHDTRRCTRRMHALRVFHVA